jgi:metal-responsive CopG/Arc/MetJ family transcriptional regulator
MSLTKQIKLNIKLNKKLNNQIDLITNTEYINRQESIEHLLEQLNDIYQDELQFQQELNNN